MGQNNTHSLLDRKLSLTLPYSDYDQLLFILNEFIKDKIDKETISKKFPYINIQEVVEIKTNQKKKKNFLDWYKKWTKHDEIKKIKELKLASISPIISYKSLDLSFKNSLKKSNSNIEEIEEISECEKGLRKYYNNNQKDFKLKTLFYPSEPFRWLNWIICGNVPDTRLNDYYLNILKHPLDENISNLINKDIKRSLQENKISNNELSESLFRILKSIALLDKELSYCQGMNFICGFMLITFDGNETDSFFLLMSLFSQTFVRSKFDLRGFFIENFPLLGLYIYIFKYYLRKKFKKIFEHLNNLEIPNQSWIAKWFQTLFVHSFPINDVIRIWDGIFSEGLKFIISCNDLIEVVDLFKMLNSSYYNIEEGFKFDIEKFIEDTKNFNISDDDFNKFKDDYQNNKIDIIENEEYNKNLKNVYKIYEYSTFPIYEESEDEIKIIQQMSKNGEKNVFSYRKKNNEDEESVIDKINQFLINTDYNEIYINNSELIQKIPLIDYNNDNNVN